MARPKNIYALAVEDVRREISSFKKRASKTQVRPLASENLRVDGRAAPKPGTVQEALKARGINLGDLRKVHGRT